MATVGQASLSRQQVFISEKVVRRLMKQAHLQASRPKRRGYRSYAGEITPAPENIVNRDFNATAPNEKWLTDISEFQIPVGKVYLSPIIDRFDGMVVSWSIGTSPNAELVNTMLDRPSRRWPEATGSLSFIPIAIAVPTTDGLVRYHGSRRQT